MHQDDVGCDSYKNNENSAQAVITAVVNDSNVCPSECDGYNTYVRGQDNFFPSKLDYLIPSTAKTCRWLVDGVCHAFTNLAAHKPGANKDNIILICDNAISLPPPALIFIPGKAATRKGQQLIKYS